MQKKSCVGNLESRDYLGNLGADGRIVPKQIHVVTDWQIVEWIHEENVTVPCEHINEPQVR